MLKNTSISVSILTLLLASPALATDVYHQGGMKDETGAPVSATSNSNHSGFYLKGDLGIAQGDRDVSRNISGEAGKTKIDQKGPDRKWGENCDGEAPSAACADNTLDDVLYYDPKYIGALAGINDSGSFDGMVFGGELSYLRHAPGARLGWELALGATFYNDSKTSHGFDGVFDGKFRELEDGIPGEAEDFSTAIVGYTNVERDLDIDFILRGHYFLAQNWSLYAGGGLSLARATLSGEVAGTAPDGSPVGHSFKDTVWAPGYVLNAGTQYWLNDRMTIGLDYTYKAHKFDTTKNSTFGDGEDCDPYLSVSDKASAKDDVHAIKARLGIQLGTVLPSLE